MRYLLLTLAALGLCGNLRAADPVKLPKELALVPGDALGFFSMDVAAVAEHPAFRGMRESLAKSAVNDEMTQAIGLRFEDVARYTAVMLAPSGTDEPRRFEPEVVMLITARKPFDKGRVVKAAGLYGIDEAKKVLGNHKEAGLGGKRPEPSGKTDAAYFVGTGGRVVAFADDRTIVLWPTHGRIHKVADTPNPLELLKTNAEAGTLNDGLLLAAKFPLAGAANLMAIKQAFRNDSPPDEFLPLMRADKFYGHATLGKDAVELTLKAEFADKLWAAEGEEAAQKIRSFVTGMMKEDVAHATKRSGADAAETQFLQMFVTALDKAVLKRDGNDVALTGRFDLGPKAQAILTALPGATEGANPVKSLNNLKQIGLAFHNYESVYQSFPSNVNAADGKPLLSWRVQILPFLAQEELYKQFKLDEPWDSDHNKKLIEKMPVVYALPNVKTKEAGQTFYQSFVAKKKVAGRPFLLEGEKNGLRLAAVTDGLSNTFLCAEAADPVVWTKPDDLPFDPKGKLPKLGGHFLKDSFQVLFCDGSVRTFKTAMPEAKLKAYITINGAEVIQDD